MDISQEALIRAYRKRSSFKHKSKIYTWLYRITYNLSIDYFKKRKPYVSLENIPVLKDKNNPRKNILNKEKAKQIEKAIRTLPPQQRAIFELKAKEELKHKEIAEIMKCSEGNIKANYFHAIKKLQKELITLK
jgi:RNA polymerase sigma-70 factor (ECF subfamily)